MWALFADPDASFLEVKTRYDVLCTTPAYRENPHLVHALERLSGDTLENACRFLASENLPRTNNHVEGTARRFRKRQKNHYKLRHATTIDRAMKAELVRQQARKQASGTPPVRLHPKLDAQLQNPPAQAA